jgi:hypothetical protein
MANQEIPFEIISRRELQARLGISEATAIKLDKQGKLKCFKVGGSVKYEWGQVLEEIRKNPAYNAR